MNVVFHQKSFIIIVDLGDFQYGAFQFDLCRNFTLSGDGIIDGQGYDWWVKVFETGIDRRPHMFLMTRCVDVEIKEIHLRNSPMFHLKVFFVTIYYNLLYILFLYWFYECFCFNYLYLFCCNLFYFFDENFLIIEIFSPSIDL